VKTATTPFVVGQNATYLLTVNNVSQAPTSGTTTITDVLPAGLGFVSAAGTGWTCGFASGTVTCTNPAVIAAGASSSVTVTVAVAAAAVPSVTNTGTVQSPGDSNPGNNDSTITTPVQVLDVAIAKSHTGNFVVGQNGSYTLTVTNVGNLATTGGLTVTDNLPAGLAFVSASGTGWSCSASGSAVTCANPRPLPRRGHSGHCSPSRFPSLRSVGHQRGDRGHAGEPGAGNNTASDPTTVSTTLDVAITKIHSGNLRSAERRLHPSRDEHGKLSTTGGLTVTDNLPSGLSFVSATGTGWTCSALGAVVTCTNPATLPPGGAAPSITLTVAVSSAAVPSVTNVAIVSTPGDSNPTNNIARDPTIVSEPSPSLDLAIQKSASPGAFIVGQNGTYLLNVTNISSIPTTGTTTVTDILASGLTYVSATGSGWSCSVTGQAISCTTGTPIAPGATTVITVTVAVGPAAAPGVRNTGIVKTPGDTIPANDTSTVTTPVGTGGNQIDLEILKTSSSLVQGQQGTFTLTITNLLDHVQADHDNGCDPGG
jgi:uncharacterized repeat protein (TIGR01451 family)